MIKNYYAFFQINCGLPTVFNFLVRWTCPAYWVDFSTVTSGLPLAEYSVRTWFIFNKNGKNNWTYIISEDGDNNEI
ncbi:hypothetical protein CATMIT_02682 [Catenibacterium mitsuokai DSM 15897]|nr:hypothetical protein CATMIT_02682 [Catenibacterium mitsuokai DSM 15897]